MNKSNDDKLYDKIDEYMIIRQMADEYKRLVEKRKKMNFVVNPPQYEKFKRAIEIMQMFMEEFEGEEETVDNDVYCPHKDYSIKVNIFVVDSDNIKIYKELLELVNAFHISVFADGALRVEIVVSNVMIPKE